MNERGSVAEKPNPWQALVGKKWARAVEQGCRSMLVDQQLCPDAKMSTGFNPAAIDDVKT